MCMRIRAGVRSVCGVITLVSVLQLATLVSCCSRPGRRRRRADAGSSRRWRREQTLPSDRRRAGSSSACGRLQAAGADARWGRQRRISPFVRRIYKFALGPDWLIAELVAPKWDAKQAEQLVWPTAKSRYAAAKFTTEEFIKAVVADAGTKVKLDPSRVFTIGWSSGGPPAYSAALATDSPVKGAFVAMSVFKPDQLPPLAAAKGKPFYLLQSPDDKVTHSALRPPLSKACAVLRQRSRCSNTPAATAGAATSFR